MNTVYCIVKDKSGKILGIEARVDSVDCKMTCDDIVRCGRSIVFDNAIVVYDHVRARSGSLPVKVVNTKPNARENLERGKSSSLLSKDIITLYHGSKEKMIIPKYGYGKSSNDYGSGFYTSPDKELAKEWAYAGYTQGSNGYLHSYKYNLSGLSILDFCALGTSNWVAELMYNRKLKEVDLDLKERVSDFINIYKLDTSKHDILIGYRADDRYYSYINRFVSGLWSLESVEKAIRFGDLGLQVFIKSKKAFQVLRKSTHGCELVPISYKNKFFKRDEMARRNFDILDRENRSRSKKDETYILDLIR